MQSGTMRLYARLAITWGKAHLCMEVLAGRACSEVGQAAGGPLRNSRRAVIQKVNQLVNGAG